MKRKREIAIICNRLAEAGIDTTAELQKAIGEALKDIRKEKYEARQYAAFKYFEDKYKKDKEDREGG